MNTIYKSRPSNGGVTVSSSPTEIRLQLLANGFTCLANVDKRCFLPDWPKLQVDAALIDRWSRRHSRYQDTGLRIQDGLAVIDIDVNHQLAAKLLAEIERRWPDMLDALVRRGKGHKLAIFCRTTEPFGRLHSFRFWLDGLNNPDTDGAHCVEVFGGGAPRQFGAFGAHTRAVNGEVLIGYRWDDDISPLNVPLDKLPAFPKATFVHVVELSGRLLREAGGEQVTRSTSGENKARRVYDLTDDMQFECNDGVMRSLAELQEIAGRAGLRCSASWLEPGRGHRPDRCLIGRSRHGVMTLYDTATETTHMPVYADPHGIAQRVADQTAVARLKVQKLRETCHD